MDDQEIEYNTVAVGPQTLSPARQPLVIYDSPFIAFLTFDVYHLVMSDSR